MKEADVNYRKHVLICSEDDGCWKVGGNNIYSKLREYITKNDLISSVLITRTRCLDCCNDVGATVVIYPDNKWFTMVTKKDLDRIIKEIEG